MSGLPIKICDVSLRDGMQVLNRHAVIPLEARLRLIEALVVAGLPYIEVGSFVNPHVVPAMADTAELMSRMPPYEGQIAALVPNLKYYEELKRAERVNTVALFVSASEEYARKNTRMTVDQAVDAAARVAEAAVRDGYRLRGYLSFAFRDPSEPDGRMPVEQVERITRRLTDMGCEVVALSDTDGMASPSDLQRTLGHMRETTGMGAIGVHLHDRRGLGITNAYAAYQAGARIFDASIAGIGGAITVRHSIGNISTEELVSLFDSIGVDSGIDVEPLIQAGCRVSQMADLVGDPPPPSRIVLDELARRRAEAEETEGIEADLTLRDLLDSLLGIIERRPEVLSLEAVRDSLTDAGKQAVRFLYAPTNRAAVVFSLMLMLGVAGVGALFVRLLPTDWVGRPEVIAITLFSLAMVLALGFGLTLVQVAGLHLPRKPTDDEREMVRGAVASILEDLDHTTGLEHGGV
jgi:isopropylmalate/homocitrate/citramalate synthase